MSILSTVYKDSLALLTDLYELTMAYGYWKTGMAEREAVFHLTFRHCPFQGQYAIACGLSYVVDYLRKLQFHDDDLTYLATLNGANDQPLFAAAFLEYLGRQTFACDVDALCARLRERYETSLVPGRFFGASEHVRVGLCGEPEIFREGLARLGSALDELGGGA